MEPLKFHIATARISQRPMCLILVVAAADDDEGT